MSQVIENLKRNPSLLVGIVILIVCGGIGALRANQLLKLSDQEAELSAKLDKIKLNIKHSANIEKDIQKLNELVGTIDKRLFVGEERSTNIDFFYSFEEQLDIIISEVKQLEASSVRFSKNGPDELKLYSVVDYDVTVSGSFHEILRFLYEVHRIESIMRVSNFQIDVTGDRSDESGKLLAKVRVSVLATK